MKLRLVVIFLLISAPAILLSQISLTVLGQESGGSVTSGDVISWQITLPTGATVDNELWVDVNGNGVVEMSTDVLIFRFTQQDGGQATDGPGDDDTTANGLVTTSFAAGFAPAAWIFVVSHASGSDTSAFTVLPLASPVATITGNVTVPSGYSREYRLVEASPDAENNSTIPEFWQALTDASGNYTIAMGGDPASKNPWRVRINTDGTTLAVVRRDSTVTIGIVAANVDFELIGGTLLTGTIREEGSNNPIQTAEIHTHPAPAGSPNTGNNYGARAGSDGTFEFVVPPGDYLLHVNVGGYFEEWWDNAPDDQSATTITVTTQDTIKNLDFLLLRGGEIRGHVRYNGAGVQASVTLLASDSTELHYDGTNDNGEYSLTVLPGSYYVKFDYNGNVLYYNQKTTLPGDLITITGTEAVDNIDADFITPTSVEKAEEIPTAFTLHRNYPNPFNPTTTIAFDLPLETHVRITVYNALGEQMGTIVDGVRSAGTHTAAFDASALPSGLYIYRMQAGAFSAVRKMSLIK